MTHAGSKAYIWIMLVTLQACGGAAEPRPEHPSPQASSSAMTSAENTGSDGYLSFDDATAFCVRLHEELVSCAPEFMDLIIDLRRRYDASWPKNHPTPEAEAEARVIGIEETKEEGTGPLESRRERCRGYAQAPKTLSDVPAKVEPCFKITDCTQRVECTRPVMEARFRARAEAAAGTQPNDKAQ